MIRHIIFDLGNVLIDIHPERAIRALAESCHKEAADLQSFFHSPLHLEFMQGRLSPRKFQQKFCETYRCALPYPDFVSGWTQLIGTPKRGIAKLVRELSPRYLLSVCSNTDPLHWEKALESCPILSEFRFFFLSYQVGSNKPDREIFQQMRTVLQAEPQECVFIDDTRKNIAGAGALGYPAIHASQSAVIRQQLRGLGAL